MGGGLGKTSRSLTTLKLALEGAQQAGADVELLATNDFNLPFFIPDQKLEEYPEAVAITAFLDKIRAADAYIWASPVYHGTMSASFKNGLDFLELLPRRPRLYLEGKVVGMLAVGSGQIGAPMALTAMWQTARALRALVATYSIPVPNSKQIFDTEGNLQDEKMVGQLAVLGREVAELGRLYQQMPQSDFKRKS